MKENGMDGACSKHGRDLKLEWNFGRETWREGTTRKT